MFATIVRCGKVFTLRLHDDETIWRAPPETALDQEPQRRVSRFESAWHAQSDQGRAAITSSNLFPATILKRKAVVYVRQSTQAQVQLNLVSGLRRNDKPPWCWPNFGRRKELIRPDL